MDTSSPSTTEQFIGQLNNDDLGPLFTDKLRLECNSLSPIAEILKGYSKSSRHASTGAAEMALHPQFSQIGAILAQPDLRMLHRTGGGSVDLGFFSAYRNRSVSQDAIVTVTPSFENSSLIRLFETPDEYLTWWLETIATEVEQTGPNYMAPPVSLESLVYLLHAIDAYRRASFQTMLSYTPTDEPFIGSKEFAETLNSSMGSRDLRWLLPSFLYLTPGLNECTFDPRPEHLDALIERDFLLVGRHPRTGEEVFFFGEAGRTMGIEFYRTWMMAVGMEITIATRGGQRSLHRAFLAPTALANHFIRLESDANGGCVANHQATTLVELADKLREMLLSALATPNT